MSKEVGAWLGRRPWRPAGGGAPVGAGSPPEVPARWSAARKTEVVLRLLRGDLPDEPLLAAAEAARRRTAWRHPPTRCHRSSPAITVSRFPGA